MENLIKRYLDYEGLKYHHDKIVDYIISLTKGLRYNESTRKIEFYNINNEKLGEIDSNLIFNPDNYYNSEQIDSKLENKADKLDLKWIDGEGINSAVLRDSEGQAKGNYSVVEGKNSVTGQALVTEPTEPFSPGDFAHAEGAATCARGIASHAEGWLTQAQGIRTHAEGYRTKANGTNDHAEGNQTTASGGASHAEGYNTKSTGETSHAEGQGSVSGGQASHAEGYFTETKNLGEHASGKYNYSNSGTGGNTLFTVGIGNSTQRGNALALFSTGNLYLYNVGNYNGTILDQDTESIQDIIKTNLLTQEEINDLIPII